jgi:hypothetical protein
VCVCVCVYCLWWVVVGGVVLIRVFLPRDVDPEQHD